MVRVLLGGRGVPVGGELRSPARRGLRRVPRGDGHVLTRDRDDRVVHAAGGADARDARRRQAEASPTRSSAALTVFHINITRVIGPTPPGTGVIARAF